MSEEQIWERLIEKVQASLACMGIPKLTDTRNHRYIRTYDGAQGIGYTAESGYSDMYFPDRSNTLTAVYQTDSEDEMLYYILYQCAERYAKQYEMHHRNELEAQWQLPLKYDGRRHWFAMTIQLMHKVYSPEQVEPLIEKYTALMNLWFEVPAWRFDAETLEFAETGIVKPKTGPRRLP